MLTDSNGHKAVGQILANKDSWKTKREMEKSGAGGAKRRRYYQCGLTTHE